MAKEPSRRRKHRVSSGRLRKRRVNATGRNESPIHRVLIVRRALVHSPQFSALSSGDRVPEKDDQGMKSTAHDSDKHSVVDENHRAVFSVPDRNGEADRKPRP